MLQRAASNAYSWWWASHIRTKQSKWLEENLQDMEDKVGSMLQIIENSGDTFAQRSEMYFRKRPELINHVEESYRAYRALAQRYDKLSKDLQSANRTIATVFPDQVQYSMDDDDDFDYEAHRPPKLSSSLDDPDRPRANIPRVPDKEFKSYSLVQTRKGQLNRCIQINRAASSTRAMHPTSGLSKEEALEEIDKLQKDILTLQTEMEFAQSISERCHAKCRGIEDQINEKQGKISNLQDEFGIGKAIDDDEARTLMAATALKSCKDSLVKLQEKQEQSAQEAQIEQQRIKGVHHKITSLKGEFVPLEADIQETIDEPESEKLDPHDVEAVREKIKSELDADPESSITVMQLAERIDELVERVANLETAVSSQHALVSTVRSDTNVLQEQVKIVEEDKETLKENSDFMRKKLEELEEEVRRVKKLNGSIIVQNKNLITLFTEASCNISHLSVKLQHMKPEDELENEELTDELMDSLEAIVGKKSEREGENEETEELLGIGDAAKADESDQTQNPDEYLNPGQRLKDSQNTMTEESWTDEEEDQPDWRQLFSRSLEDREKLLIEEYSSVLRNYKDVKKKLGDVEKKNRDGFFELALQIKELKNALVLKDKEIKALRKMDSPDQNPDDTQVSPSQNLNETHGNTPENFKFPHPEGSPESMTQATSVPDYNLSSLCSPQEPAFDSQSENLEESKGKTGELAPYRSIRRYNSKESGRNEIKMKRGESPRVVSAIEEKFRSDIDDLLEDNLEFWLRFSTSFHQITKFQNSVHDLKMELSKLKDKRTPDGNVLAISPPLISEARPIYRHLREIQTDLTLWLENNSVMKDEMQGRFESLCNIQEEISKISHASCRGDEAELSVYQAAKFQGEILNMKQENKKVDDQLHAGLERVRGLKSDVEKTLANLDEQLGLAATTKRSTSSKTRIPLRSFLFGVKLKKKQKPSLFSCVSPALQKQYSIMAAPTKLPE